MALPSVEKYVQLVDERDPKRLGALASCNFLRSTDGHQFLTHIGTSAIVFEALAEGRKQAVRFFLRAESETGSRYQHLSQFFFLNSQPWAVPFNVVNNEVNVDGEYYPVVVMNWAKGTPLNEYIDKNLRSPDALSVLQEKLVQLQNSMEEKGIAHGDLKYNNIFVDETEGHTLRLIDYDTMFIPAFAGKKSLEIGSPGFQPLKRLNSHYDERVDRFSIWVLIASIEVVKTAPEYWLQMESGGHNNEHSIFSVSDFLSPQSSSLIQKLKVLSSPALHFYLDQVLNHTKVNHPGDVPKPTLFAAGINGLQKPVIPLIKGHEVTPPSHEKREILESAEIVEFSADRYEVKKGETATLNWKVKGEGKVVISHLGAVTERVGSRRIAPRQSTRYELTIGNLKKAIAIEVMPEPTTVTGLDSITQTPRRFRIPETEKKPALSKNNSKLAIGAGAIFLLSIMAYMGYQRMKNAQPEIETSVQTAGMVQQTSFNTASVQNVLRSLYTAYNKRDLASISNHYAPVINAYYDSKEITKDSLTAVIRDLFLAPAAYNCKPQFNTMRLEQENDHCKVYITITEKLQQNRNSRPESYETKIEYVLDSGFKIISEKNQ
jgi:serine/threonine protein kinase